MYELSETDLEKFWGFVTKKGPDECWPWTRRDGDIPIFKYGGKPASALRIMYELYYDKPVPEGKTVLRKCGTKGFDCINPRHFVIVTNGTSFKIWSERRIRKAQRSIHALAELAGFDLMPLENGHYLVVKGDFQNEWGF